MSPEIFPLPIFPQGGLRESVITTVWIGVVVATFFNVRFGWTFTGIVVPGYLVPLLLNKPLSAFTIIFEGLLTYLLVAFFSELLSRAGMWSRLFGRDRFFALFLGSVLVRLVFDGWLLPELGDYLVENLNFRLDYRNDLHSFGTVVVALVANSFWKTGFCAGIIPLSVNIGVTFLLTRFVLMEFTNFNIGSLLYLYEDVAVSFYASPKAYIIILVTAFVSSRMNLRYGWDFNGILLPALLALQWYQPSKILTTLVEALLVVALVQGYLSLPKIRERSYQGAKKLVLFFNASFLYKFILGYMAIWYFPQTKITDYYGFGYLLPCLLAIKISDKHIPVRLAVSTVATSMLGVTIATAIGYTLTYIPNPFLSMLTVEEQVSLYPMSTGVRSSFDLAQRAKLYAFAKQANEKVSIPRRQELRLFAEGLSQLRDYLRTQDQSHLSQARSNFRSVSYDVELHNKSLLVLKEINQNRGWGYFLIRSKKPVPSGLHLEVPEPVSEWNTVESSAVLFEQLKADSLAIAGSSLDANADGSSNVLLQRNTFFYLFHSIFSGENILQIRGYSVSAKKVMYQHLLDVEKNDMGDPYSTLWVTQDLPKSLNLKELKELIGSYKIFWDGSPFKNVLRKDTQSGFASLWLNRADRRSLLFKPLLNFSLVDREDHKLAIDGYLQEWLLGTKRRIAPSGSGAYHPPTLQELLFLEQEVVKPLIEIVKSGFEDGSLSADGLKELSAINVAARVLHMQVRWYRHSGSGKNYLILSDNESRDRHYGGTYVFRIDPQEPFIIQVPRPLSDRNSFEVAVALFEQTNGEMLAISGSHRHANTDGSADILNFENRKNVFNLVSQVFLRTSGSASQLVLHSRAFGYHEEREINTDVIVSPDSGISLEGKASSLLENLTFYLESSGLRYEFQRGAKSTVGLGGSGLVQARYLEQVRNKEFAVLWFSPYLRSRFQQQDDNRRQAANFASVGITTLEESLVDFILEYKHGTPQQLNEELANLVDRYVGQGDVVALFEIKARYPGILLKRLIDTRTKRAYLIIQNEHDNFPLVANLSPHPAADIAYRIGNVSDVNSPNIERFVNSGAKWLLIEGGS